MNVNAENMTAAEDRSVKEDSNNAAKFGVSQVATSQVVGGNGVVNDLEELALALNNLDRVPPMR
jgi:hypothetical protein